MIGFNRLLYLISLINFHCVFSISNNGNANPIVKTTNGLVQGELLSNNWYRYRGIPYAEPPVGTLRFEVSTNKTVFLGGYPIWENLTLLSSDYWLM